MTGFLAAVHQATKKQSRGVCEGRGLAEATEGAYVCGKHTDCHGVAQTTNGDLVKGADERFVPASTCYLCPSSESPTSRATGDDRQTTAAGTNSSPGRGRNSAPIQ